MPPLARKTDLASGHEGFPATPATTGSGDVEVNGLPALRLGDGFADHSKPGHPPHARALAAGSPTVFINGLPAGRLGDSVDCGGAVISASPDVDIDTGG